MFNYKRRQSSVSLIGDTPVGGEHPIRIQSMANVSTMNTDAAVSQALRMIEAGADYIRFTAQSDREAYNLGIIKQRLRRKGCQTPLIADIHFSANAAKVAATQVEKVRINPGNFATSPDLLYSRFTAFLRICRSRKVAIRIGVNHGSLSEQIMEKYGNSPEGMVASCMELLDICVREDFHNIVISMKSSNAGVMVRTVRLLIAEMEQQGMKYPLHLGVTEAGDGEDGRIKSAVGIGALLVDGLGDTVRVSLSEDPEKELPVARKLLDYIGSREGHSPIEGSEFPDYNHMEAERRISRSVGAIGGGQPPLAIPSEYGGKLIPITLDMLTPEFIGQLSANPEAVGILSSSHQNPVGEMRAAMHRLVTAGCDIPVVLRMDYAESDPETLTIKAAADLGTLLLDGFGDGLMITNNGATTDETQNLIYGIMQATRTRISKTEYISCPGCGRTLYDLQTTVARVKAATSGQKGLKIGIMGCIVNGPGEMADADYGYVGSGHGKVSLYKGKTCIMKSIPEEDAVNRLVKLIKDSGDWRDED